MVETTKKTAVFASFASIVKGSQQNFLPAFREILKRKIIEEIYAVSKILNDSRRDFSS